MNTCTPTVTWYGLSNYNCGSLLAKTFNLWEYTDYIEYSEALTAWLTSIGEEEYILADSEEIPREYISEYHLAPEFWEFMSISDRLGYDLCCAALSLDIPLDSIEEAYLGEYSSMEDYAYEYLSECYELDKLPSIITCHIDWEGVARDLSVEVNFENGYVFSGSW
jgi:antirestriction protein